jgi:hypothetical protein
MSNQKTGISKLIAVIGAFIAGLFKTAGKAFNSLPKEQQDAIIQGVNISQIIKDNYAKGEIAVLSMIIDKTGVSADVAEFAVLAVAKDMGINVSTVQDFLNVLADKVQAGITDNHWNELWQSIAKFGASYLSTGKVDWVTLSLGVVEFALHQFVKN